MSNFQDEEEVIIESIKHIPEGFSIKNNFVINSNMINDINLNSLVTKSTDQDLEIGVLPGIVHFENLEIDGLYNGVNITKLDEETVKLTGEQYISSTLIFRNKLQVNNLQILETINNKTLDQLNSAKNTFDLDKIKVETLEIRGNLRGHLNFNETTRNHTCELKKAKIDQLEAITINNIASHRFSYDFIKENLKNRLEQGNFSAESEKSSIIHVVL